MKLKIITRSPYGIPENSLIQYLRAVLFTYKEMNIESLAKVKKLIYLEVDLVKEEKAVDIDPPLLIIIRETACCGEELVIAQGEINILVREDKNE